MYWRHESDRLTFGADRGDDGFNGETLAASDHLADLTCPLLPTFPTPPSWTAGAAA